MQGWVITDLTRREPDPSLREALVRRHLDEHWPPPATELCLLHADYFPGNIIWDGDAIAAVIDWESAALGDPMADIATTRLDLRWAYGAEVAERFTRRYLTMTGRSTATLPVWELVVSLRPAGAISLWASDMAAHGRPDITADSMRSRTARLRRQRTPTPRIVHVKSVVQRGDVMAGADQLSGARRNGHGAHSFICITWMRSASGTRTFRPFRRRQHGATVES